MRLPAAAWTVLVLGALVHVVWYFERGSLWLDEAFLALNIVHRSPHALLETLSFDQGAPWGFLLAEKLAITTLGASDRSFRLVPLAAALAAMPLFWRVASLYLRGVALVLAFLLFCFSPSLIRYSAETKQYSVDVLAALVALWLAHSARRIPNWRRAAAIGLAGAVLLWFSHPSMLVLGSCGLAVGGAALAQRDWPALRRLAIVGLAWAVSACAFFLFAWPKLAQLRESLDGEEPYAVPFPPSSLADAHRLGSIVRGILLFSFGSFGRPWSPVIAASAALLALAGAVFLARRDRLGAVLLIAPFIAAAAVLANGQPFAERFFLFLVPLIVILVAAGTAAALAALSQQGLERRLIAIAGVAASVFLLSVAGAATARLLADQSERGGNRQVLEHVRSAWKPGDVLYLYASAQYPARYYAEVSAVNRSSAGRTLWSVSSTALPRGTSVVALRSAPPSLVVGQYTPDGGSTFFRDLAAVHGRRRVWFVFSNVVRFNGANIVDDLDRHISALDAAGRRRATFHRGAALAVLYDLGTPSGRRVGLTGKAGNGS